MGNRVIRSSHQSIHLPFSVYQSQISVLMGIHCILSPPASPIHHTTTRTCTLPLRGPLNQALHMPDPHLLSPPLLSTTPSPLPIPCSHSGFSSVAAAALLPSATTQQRGKEWGKDGWKNRGGPGRHGGRERMEPRKPKKVRKKDKKERVHLYTV